MLLFFETMEPLYGIRPDKYAYTAVFWACWTCGEWRRAVEYIERMESAGCQPDTVIYTTLIHMYEANGELGTATELLFERLATHQ